jgi:hypothetical protein
MSELLTVHRQWASRPADERYLSLEDMRDAAQRIKDECHAETASIKDLRFEATSEGDIVCYLTGKKDNGKFAKAQRYNTTHWSFNQVATKIACPADYMRRLPANLAVDNLNHCIQNGNYGYNDRMQFLMRQNGTSELRAANGETYGRIWNSDILTPVINRYGNGLDGRFRVPGEFKASVPITVDNTTLYMGDRDMFVFLADEDNRIELPDRRDGEAGSLARGFYFWNSEVGYRTFGCATFYFDYVCCNRIIWGVEEVQEFKMRHSKYAPEKFIKEVLPSLQMFSEGSSKGILSAIAGARAVTFEKPEEITEFMTEKLKLGKKVTDKVDGQFLLEEGRPMASVWDIVTGVTAFARSMDYQCDRVELEQKAGEILKKFAA